MLSPAHASPCTSISRWKSTTRSTVGKYAMRQEIPMYRRSTNLTVLLCCAALLSGCATRKERLLPHGDATMLDVWNQNTAGGLTNPHPSRVLEDARSSLWRPLTRSDRGAASTDTVA